jgi:hypothetical protein
MLGGGYFAESARLGGTVCQLSKVGRALKPASSGPSPYLLRHQAHTPPNTCPEGGCQGLFTMIQDAFARLWISDEPRRVRARREVA